MIANWESRARAGLGRLWRALRRHGGEIAYCAGIALALTALAAGAERYRAARTLAPEPASLPAVDFSEPVEEEPKEAAAPAMPEGAALLRGYSAEPAWSAALGLWESHPAVDYRLPGDEARCLLPGTILAVERGGALGGLVEVDCGAVTLRYGSIEPREDLAPGDALAAGEIVGIAGEMPGEANLGPHLHLELIADGAALDFARWAAEARPPDGD